MKIKLEYIHGQVVATDSATGKPIDENNFPAPLLDCYRESILIFREHIPALDYKMKQLREVQSVDRLVMQFELGER